MVFLALAGLMTVLWRKEFAMRKRQSRADRGNDQRESHMTAR